MIAHVSPVGHGLVVVAGAAAMGGYGVLWGRDPVRRSGPYLAWMLGVAAVVVATSTPVEGLGHRSFTGHMAQHLILLLVAPPLLVLARPYALWCRGHPRRHLLGPSTTAWIRGVAPLASAAGFVMVLAVTHFSPLYDLSLRHQGVHEIEHACYLGSAVALWSAILAHGQQHAGRRLAAVFGVIAGSNLVGLILMSATVPLVPTYEAQMGTAQALADQRSASAFMWVAGMTATLPLAIATIWRWARAEQRRAEAAERLSDQAAERLSDQAAERLSDQAAERLSDQAAEAAVGSRQAGCTVGVGAGGSGGPDPADDEPGGRVGSWG